MSNIKGKILYFLTSQYRRVKFKDITQVWKLPIALLISFLFRLIEKDLWIICEDENEARDNGYWFFKYVRKNHPKQKCVYAIRKSSPDYVKVASMGKTVEYGSLMHWILYLASSKKISSQKAGNPNATIFYFLEVFGILKDRRVFLQHGITKDDSKWLYYSVTKFDRFICGAYPEYKFVVETFGYPQKNICYTGFCRFDGLHNKALLEDKYILIMPTWREWIANKDERIQGYEGTKEISQTDYFVYWNDFLNDTKLKDICLKHDIHFIFYPHRNMQKYISYFPKSTSYLKIASSKEKDIQSLFKVASMMVTDYSSVAFDMFYMQKPVVYYQFDYDKFRKYQYGEGYFHYDDNPFANGFQNKDKVFAEIEKYINNGFQVSSKYLEAHRDYFRYYDTENCRRVYDVIRKL